MALEVSADIEVVSEQRGHATMTLTGDVDRA
jgi:hypothetical protein